MVHHFHLQLGCFVDLFALGFFVSPSTGIHSPLGHFIRTGPVFEVSSISHQIDQVSDLKINLYKSELFCFDEAPRYLR
jgi:hypothetical protein